MEYISSKNIFLLLKDTLAMIDERAMNHGMRVAYYVSKMLECKGGYEKFEIADIVILTTFHDIGAYKTNDFSDLLHFEYKDFMPHSVYGYLFMKYLSPLDDLSRVLLYHHVDSRQLELIDYEYKNLSAYIHVADRNDIYSTVLGNKFDTKLLERYRGNQFTDEALSLFYEAEERFHMADRVKSGEYKQDLDEIEDYLIFSNEEKKKYLEMLTFCVGFRSQSFVENEVTCLCIANELGEKIFLDDAQLEILYYGALLHDIGMLAIPSEIIEAPRKLTAEEIRCLRTHVEKAEKVLRANSMNEEVIELVSAHHERGDGSGYPGKLEDKQMSKLQKLLQVADVVTGLCNRRSYREAKSKEEITAILLDEAAKGLLNKPIVNIMITFYDDIMEKVKKESEKMMKMYNKLNTNYELVSRQFEK